ncbi:uncharacterized protein BYT42DRAFT_131806 [Radiomyces spectabilis]|uniref:uncharacterized protein n=1 Tax=Radiomyces spectabilis TaxID=64574 RepID=UPI00221EA3FF|nr:uncharacterized protein BYT42DRAFT_131806 [Radiomyces spectabilis]KAI8367580.1 hypothetical protein BYT42DRAFT_131806 [Radiomyces spectabilis]
MPHHFSFVFIYFCRNNRISLLIIKSLIQTCHRDLNLFSKYVVRIFSMILNTRDIDLIDLTCETYIVFCDHHEGATLGVDPEFTADYESLLDKFAGFCNYTNADRSVALKMRYIGHRAIQAAVMSTALKASDIKTQLNTILPPVVATLAQSKEPIQQLSTNDGSMDIRRSAVAEGDVQQMSIDLLASQTLSILYNKTNGAAVRMSLTTMFKFIDDNDLWWPSEFAASIARLILDSLQPQYRYLLVSEMLQQLDQLDKTHVNAKSASLIAILDNVLNANLALVGISVLEVLNTLFSLLMWWLGDRSPREQLPEEASEQDQYEYTVHTGVINCIGGLASQTYYQNQLNDIAGYLVAKLRTSTTLDVIDQLPIATYRYIVLRCLEAVIRTTKHTDPLSHTTSSEEMSMLPPAVNFIAANVWTPALSLLTDRYAETRLMFARTLSLYLSTSLMERVPETPQIRTDSPGPYRLSHGCSISSMDSSSKHLLYCHGDTMFLNTLQQLIVEWVELPDCEFEEVYAAYDLLCAIVHRFKIDGIIQCVPLIFKLQDLIKEHSLGSPAQERAVATITLEWLSMVGHSYHLESLCDYTDKLKEERVQANQYFELAASEQSTDAKELEAREKQNDTPVDKFIDRHVVVDALSKDSQFRDRSDRHGLDLESKLYIEWGAKLGANGDHAFRICTSPSVEDLKPKLATTPWLSTDVRTRAWTWCVIFHGQTLIYFS